jgi:hypothetical protein
MPTKEGYLLVFDGPAQAERIWMAVPPGPIRWFCRSGEMGSDESIEWWVTAEAPPEDESVEVTEYRLDVSVEAEIDEETNGVRIPFTCDSEKWFSAQDFSGLQVPDSSNEDQGPGIPRSYFEAGDISKILVNGNWYEVATPGKMAELLIEPGVGGNVKISTGANLIYKDGDEYVAISPVNVNGFRLRPSSVAQEPEIHQDGTVRVSRDVYDADDEQIKAAVAGAATVYVIEPDGFPTQVKNDGEFVA